MFSEVSLKSEDADLHTVNSGTGENLSPLPAAIGDQLGLRNGRYLTTNHGIA
jgi:hypothetical protein